MILDRNVCQGWSSIWMGLYLVWPDVQCMNVVVKLTHSTNKPIRLGCLHADATYRGFTAECEWMCSPVLRDDAYSNHNKTDHWPHWRVPLPGQHVPATQWHWCYSGTILVGFGNCSANPWTVPSFRNFGIACERAQ